MSDIDSSELSVGRRTTPDKFASEHSDVPPGAGHGRQEREGLPASYRMRADAHYVEQLGSRRERAPEASRANGAADGFDRDAAPDQRDRRSDRVMGQLSEEIAAIVSAAGLLTADGAPLARRISADLIRAHAWRAQWLLRASTVLDGRHRGQTRPRPVGMLLEQIRQGLAAECRLAGVTLHLHATDWNAVVAVDEQAVVTGITGAVLATLGVIGEAEGTIVRVTVESSGGELRGVEIAQDDVSVSATASVRFFDASWADRPGGWTAGLAAQAVRSIAQQLGGSAVFSGANERRGTAIRLSLARI